MMYIYFLRLHVSAHWKITSQESIKLISNELRHIWFINPLFSGCTTATGTGARAVGNHSCRGSIRWTGRRLDNPLRRDKNEDNDGSSRTICLAIHRGHLDPPPRRAIRSIQRRRSSFLLDRSARRHEFRWVRARKKGHGQKRRNRWAPSPEIDSHQIFVHHMNEFFWFFLELFLRIQLAHQFVENSVVTK